MGQDGGSWVPQRRKDTQLPNLNTLSAPFGSWPPGTVPRCRNVDPIMASVQEDVPFYRNIELPVPRVGVEIKSCGWFNDISYSRQAFEPAFGNADVPALPKLWTGSTQKKFIVFDQSGDQTTLIFGSGSDYYRPKQTFPACLTRDCLEINGDSGFNRERLSMNDFDEKNESEMQEDTEELNALLYSDDESDYTEEDDDVRSTGHSPSTMTEHNETEMYVGNTDCVASSNAPTKKRKLFTSITPEKSSELEDDAESSCANENHLSSKECGLASGVKRMKEDKIRDTVSVLRGIVPGAEEKDPIVILDQAIEYLKSLKKKAETLGLATL